jgi:hypothetical protein
MTLFHYILPLLLPFLVLFCSSPIFLLLLLTQCMDFHRPIAMYKTDSRYRMVPNCRGFIHFAMYKIRISATEMKFTVRFIEYYREKDYKRKQVMLVESALSKSMECGKKWICCDDNCTRHKGKGKGA